MPSDKPPPGGIGAMVGFVVAGNTAAFLALAVLWPANPDGSRTASFGSVPKSAVWPELLAILAGHVLGFACWALYLDAWSKRQRKAAKDVPPGPA